MCNVITQFINTYYNFSIWLFNGNHHICLFSTSKHQVTLWWRLWQWDAVFSLHLIFGALRTVGVCDRETADGFSSAVGESGHALTGRWKMICSPNHIYHPNTIWVPSHVHASAQTHANSPTCTCALIHLLGEQQGQEVWGLIERTHGATVTLTVKVFIRGRWLIDYATANVTKRIWAFWKDSFCAKLHPP